jgi:hypothetical protein
MNYAHYFKYTATLISYSDCNGDKDNNSIQFFIIYVPSQQPQHGVDKSNYFTEKHYTKSKTN